jgi:alkylhydroperoxidase family enzyme
VLEHRARELMVLRVAWRTRSRVEWWQHVQLAPRFGIARDDIDAIARGIDADSWSPLERDLIAATDELIDRYRIDDDTWGRLAEHLDERQLVELVFVVGTYTCLAMAFNSWGLQLEPGTDTGTVPMPG